MGVGEGRSTPSLFSRGGSLLPSIYADARCIDTVIDSQAAGDLVTYSEANDGWWFVVKADGAEGWAPADYFEEIGASAGAGADADAGAGDSFDDSDDDELPVCEPAELYLVDEDFAGDADDQLAVKKGDTVKLLEANEGGWWWMEAADGSNAGWVPTDYVVKM